ncbi:MAG: hydroxypyruvate reductase, partial [Chloroflexota bacterium]|nr:hydroxypyruvate reductase [Chloroflexota bacterium]
PPPPRPSVVWTARSGEAAALGREWVAACRAAPASVDVLLGGGEATVTVHGDGVGGRNTEFALAGALALAESGLQEWTIASLATDGDDGPTGAAGAVADAGTVARARAAGVDSAEALARNDSLRVFEAAGGLVRPGPTGTNVNDLYLAVRRT